jgi:osmotically-inducible protein OsmY
MGSAHLGGVSEKGARVTPRKRSAAIVAALTTVLAIGCDMKDSQVLTDTSAAGSADGGTAEQEQIYAAAARIREALHADSALRAADVEAEKLENYLVIEGTVPTEQERARAYEIAARHAGGIRIENRIRIQAKP